MGLLEEQQQYIAAGLSRFHTPGHSGKAAALSTLGSVLPYDVTEVGRFDSLYTADGVLRELEERAAGIFWVGQSFLSAGGCTLAIQTMLALYVPMGGKVAMGRNAHRSALSTAALLDLHPVWLYPEPGGVVSPAAVSEALAAHPDLAAVYLTSPNYYGQLCDIAAIAGICHAAGVPLLVDNAHGSHLGFLPEDLHPVHLGADCAADSVHKTLPVLTGGALLQCRTPRDPAQVKAAMNLFGSTSPSYLILSSIEQALDWLERQGREAFARLESRVAALRGLAAEMTLLTPLSAGCDPVRLTLSSRGTDVTGEQVAARFAAAGAMAEFADRTHTVFILTPFHEEGDFATLEKGLAACRDLRACPADSLSLPQPAPPVCSVRQAVFAPSLRLPVEETLGRIAAEVACPCPPGIPVLIPGEEIGPAALRLLQAGGITSLQVMR